MDAYLQFEALWEENDVIAHGEGVERMHHPDAELLELKSTSFMVEGRPELGMLVHNPASHADAKRLGAQIGLKAG